MNNLNELMQLRWGMLTNPIALLVPSMCRLTTNEVFEHSELIDELTKGKLYSNDEMMK